MRNLKQINQLMAAANDLLNVANQSQEKYESMLRFNVEHAEPNGLDEIPQEKIDFQWHVTTRVVRSYYKVLENIKNYEI